MGTTEDDRGETVRVSRKGQATIPKRFRERYGIDAPGKVRFVIDGEGHLVVEPVRSIADFRGAGESDRDASELLAAGREADRERRDRLTDEDRNA